MCVCINKDTLSPTHEYMCIKTNSYIQHNLRVAYPFDELRNKKILKQKQTKPFDSKNEERANPYGKTFMVTYIKWKTTTNK